MKFYLLAIPSLAILLLTACQPVPRPWADAFALDSMQATIPRLTRTLPESSGLIQIDSLYWLLNDSGDGPYLYAVQPQTGELVRKVEIEGAKNRDWESLTQDSSYVYIGDTGNNNGERKDLRIFRIEKTALQRGTTPIPSQLIAYHYPEQQHFDGRPHPFDCEAITTHGDSIYLFTKNRNNLKSYLYRLPKTPGTYAAQRIDSFVVKGMITDVSWDTTAGRLSLLGYNIESSTFFPFVWEWNNLSKPGFNARGTRYNLSPNVQAEAMCLHEGQGLVINAEKGHTDEQLFHWVRP